MLAFADRTWTSLRVAGPDRVVDVDLAPTHRYRTLRSSTYYAAVRDLVADPAAGIDLVHVAAAVHEVVARRGRRPRRRRRGRGGGTVGAHVGAATR